MSLARPKAVIRGGCCQHPEDCREPGEVCLTRERWLDEQTAPDVCAWCAGPVGEHDHSAPSDLCQRCYDAMPALGVPPVRDL